MANREENIKKINEELEKLSDEELEKVAGGGFYSIDTTNPENQNQVQTPNIYGAGKK